MAIFRIAVGQRGDLAGQDRFVYRGALFALGWQCRRAAEDFRDHLPRARPLSALGIASRRTRTVAGRTSSLGRIDPLAKSLRRSAEFHPDRIPAALAARFQPRRTGTLAPVTGADRYGNRLRNEEYG